MLSESAIPAAFASHLRIGTCSWKYDSWKGRVYEPDRRYRPDDYLPDYARHFTTVEIDQWFWSLFPAGVRLPDPDVGLDTYVNVNNHYEGSAPLTIQRLLDILREASPR